MLKKFTIFMLAAAIGLGTAFTADAQSKQRQQRVKQKVAEAPAPDWMANAVIYEANLRQGTPERNLKGLQKELPRLRDLGVNIIWLMPIHPISEKERKGELGSYYAVKDYKAVNPEFGTMEDFKEFVKAAHDLGLKVILDEVCNHTGADNVWVTEHPEYYAKDRKGKMISPYDWTDVYQLDYSNKGTREAMTDALKFWIQEADIDGYRCDVAGMVPTDYWEEVVPQLRAIKPIFMLAEADKPELLEKAFNADYAWPMKDVFNAIAATQGVNKYALENNKQYPVTVASAIFDLLDRQAKEYPAGSIHMNMVTNHDLNSWEGTEFERYGKGLEAFAILSYTLPGMPMMYTGQEVGFDHPFEFFVQDKNIPNYKKNSFTEFYQRLNALKATHSALNAGNPEGEMIQYPVLNQHVIAFSRTAPGDQVVVVTNLSGDEQMLTIPDEAPNLDNMIDYFTGAPAQMPVILEPWETFVFVTP